ncbi:MAG TPA: RNA pseudouridine synthase, partial [Clostridia bacterium]|nr:RNA pseudouridine synthase [Clostridia bacterium]
VYGARRQPYGLTKQVLHAYRLGFFHPATGENMVFTAPLPQYFEELLQKLRRMSSDNR